MTISVAIATYNRAPMVCEAVLAALTQSRAPQEIVVFDDASTDGTVNALERLRDPRIKVFRQSRNSGGVGNWNAALGRTCGDLIAWCSDDDRFLPGHLEASAAYLEAHPSVGLVHSGFIDALELAGGERRDPRPLRPASTLTLPGLIPYLIRYYDWPFHPSTMVFRRRVWEQVGPFHARYQFADTEWFVRAVEAFPVASLARHGVINRRHAGNWSNRLGSAHLQREVFDIVEKAIERNLSGPRRTAWKTAWRANVRLRLALTLRSRVVSRHVGAADAAWHGLLQDTGFSAPPWIERAGRAVIHGICEGREPRLRDQSRSVSPL
jgi:glycosyltransferase involved in cell wall biosynthesis